ncbi:hypothetical protein HK104_007612 [Borealophlyctis nickersoniae]|nr:hypothetical protein HK104_007612 [Borealophlyctis nickersoniae]
MQQTISTDDSNQKEANAPNGGTNTEAVDTPSPPVNPECEDASGSSNPPAANALEDINLARPFPPFDYDDLNTRVQEEQAALSDEYNAICNDIYQIIQEYVALHELLLARQEAKFGEQLMAKCADIRDTEAQQGTLSLLQIVRQKLNGFMDAIKSHFNNFIGAIPIGGH